MFILAHRGFWKKKMEQNTLTAFKRAVDHGFGIETDFRDFKGRLVISHDIARSNSLLADKAASIFKKTPSSQMLAINVKSDGLQNLLSNYLSKKRISNYFIFDASIPETVRYIRGKMTIFTRTSEFENPPALLNKAQGVWVDSFQSQWFDAKLLESYLRTKKKVCIISSELHGRNHRGLWQMIKTIPAKYQKDLGLCTDYPDKAKQYFRT